MTLENLSFGSFQIAVLIGFMIITVCLVGVFWAIARHSRQNVDFGEVTDTGYMLRRYWLTFLAILLGTGLILSLSFMPYGAAAGPTEQAKIDGYQFNWTVSPAKTKAGTTVEFTVTSKDVNHGVGFYDPDGVLIGNVQAMPGFENVVSIEFDEPGTYTLACLEYCGLGHHRMIRQFEVTP